MIDALLNGILPLFAIILAGFAAVRLKILGMNAAHVLHKFVYYFAFPPLLFRSLAKSNINQILNWPYMAAFTASMLIIYALTYLVARTALVQQPFFNPIRSFAASYPNTAYIGIPFLITLFGNDGLITAALTNFLTVVLVFVAVFSLDIQASSKSANRFTTFGKVCIKTLSNPVVCAPILGIFYSALGWPLPLGVDNFFKQLGNAAVPCALFAIGLNLKVGNFFTRPYAYSFIMAMKLIIHPLLMLGLVLWLNIPREWAISGFLMAALPTGVLSSILANRYQAYERQSDTLIFLTTLISLITLSICLLLIPFIWPTP